MSDVVLETLRRAGFAVDISKLSETRGHYFSNKIVYSSSEREDDTDKQFQGCIFYRCIMKTNVHASSKVNCVSYILIDFVSDFIPELARHVLQNLATSPSDPFYLDGLVIPKIHLDSGDISNGFLRKASLWRAYFVDSVLTNVCFENSRMKQSTIDNCTTEMCSFEGVDFKESLFQNCVKKSCTFENADFKKAELSGVVFESCKLDKANFEAVVFKNCGFIKSTFNAVHIFGDSSLTSCSFSDANIEGLCLTQVSMKKCTFNKCTLESVFFQNTTVNTCKFITCSLRLRVSGNVAFKHVSFLDIERMSLDVLSGTIYTFVGCVFQEQYPFLSTTDVRSCFFAHVGAVNSGKFFANVDIKNVDISNSDLTKTRFENVEFEAVTFDNIISDSAVFERSGIANASFKSAKMSGVVFSVCVLRAVSFENAELTNATIDKCIFTYTEGKNSVTFKHANLSHATLVGDFKFVDFSSADLNNADLSRARFTNCIFNNTDLNNAQRYSGLGKQFDSCVISVQQIASMV